MWLIKLLAKIVLSRVPVSYEAWKRMGMFRHGQMDRAAYPLKIFRLHLNHAYPDGTLPPGAHVLELGPGDSVAAALVAKAHGAEAVTLVDVGDFATHDMAFYRSLADGLREQGLAPPDLTTAETREDVLAACHARYFTTGLAALRAIPNDSIDFSWSHSVLEHIRVHEFSSMFQELYRITKPRGFSSHNIDFQDHLDYALNNLRFSPAVWESGFMVRSGFYTNRLRAAEMWDAFRHAGWTILKEQFGRWPTLPTRRSALHRSFQKWEDDELRIRTGSVLLTRPN